MTWGLQSIPSETDTSQHPYIVIAANSSGTRNGHVTNIRFTTGYQNPSLHKTRSGSRTDRKTFTHCVVYTTGFVVTVSLLLTIICITTVLWYKCADLETRLSNTEVIYARDVSDTSVCLPCNDLVQGPFDENNEQLKILKQTMDKDTMTCCAKTSALITTLFNLYVNKKDLAQRSSLRLFNKSESTGNGCNINIGVTPEVSSPSNIGPVAHLQLDPKKKQIDGSGEQPIRHWTDAGKVSHLEGVQLIDDRLRIPEAGYYFLYSQVGFLVYYDSGAGGQTKEQPNQLLFHKMYRYNPIYPNKGNQELLRSEVTQCWEQHKVYGRYTSHVGAAIRLNRGDQIYVQVSRLSALSPDDAMTFFGLFKLNN